MGRFACLVAKRSSRRFRPALSRYASAPRELVLGRYSAIAKDFSHLLQEQTMDTITETSSEGIFSRLGSSLMATVLGILMVPGSIYLLYWNEGRAVNADRALDQGLSQLVEAKADSADVSLNTRLVHVSGMADVGKPVVDETFGVSAADLLRLSRKVEMYQWKETESESSSTSVGGTKTKTKTYDYSKKWSEEPIDSSSFKSSDEHTNPDMALRSATADSADVKLGAFHVDAGVLDQAENFKPLAASIAGKLPSGYRQEGSFLFHGSDIKNPAVGDIRVSFSGISPQTFSIVAQDVAGTLSPYQAANGYVIALLEPGVVSGAQLFSERKQQEGKLTWVLRGVGFVLMLLGFMMMMSFVVTLSSVLPFLSGLVEGGAFVIAISAAVPITLLTIAFAWLTLRPLIATPLILAAVGFFVMMHRRHRPALVSKAQTA
jgi:Transmembrane protein 43